MLIIWRICEPRNRTNCGCRRHERLGPIGLSGWMPARLFGLSLGYVRATFELHSSYPWRNSLRTLTIWRRNGPKSSGLARREHTSESCCPIQLSPIVFIIIIAAEFGLCRSSCALDLSWIRAGSALGSDLDLDLDSRARTEAGVKRLSRPPSSFSPTISMSRRPSGNGGHRSTITGADPVRVGASRH